MQAVPPRTAPMLVSSAHVRTESMKSDPHGPRAQRAGTAAPVTLHEGSVAPAAGTVPATPPAPPDGEPARSQRLSILEGSLATVHITITSGSLVTAYALMLGARPIHLGLVSALTALAAVGSVAGAQAIGRLGRRKPLAVATSAGGRALWALLCVLPFLPIAPGLRLGLFLAVVCAGNLLLNIGGTGWLSWMTDLVPAERRGRFFGIRNAVLGAVGMAVSYGAGALFDRFVASDLRAPGLAVIFGAAAVFAVLAGVVLHRQWEPPLRGERPLPLRETFRLPVADRSFRRLLAFLVLWAAATGIAGPFFAAHMIRNLGMSFSSIAVYSILAGAVSLSTQPLWGRIIDRAGNRPVLILCLLGVTGLPILWLPATSAHLWPIWTDAAVTGLFWPGFALASFNLVLGTAPDESRTAYLGVHSLLVGVSGFLASLLGGWTADLLAGASVPFLGLTLVNFHLLFAVSAAGRLALLPLALGIREERSRPVRALVGLLGDQVAQRFQTGLQVGVTTIRRIGRS